MKRVLSILVLVCIVVLSVFGCKKEEKGNVIMPLYTQIDFSNMPDGIYRVKFTPDDIIEEKDGLYLNAYIYTEDLYDTVDLHQMKAGDKIFMAGSEVNIDEIHWDSQESCCCINFPSFDEAVEEFRPSESGGTYYVSGLDDHHSYTLRGQAKIKISDNCDIVDSAQWGEPEVKLDKKELKSHMTKVGDSYWHLNTNMMVENKEIIEIKHFYIP